MAILVLSGWNQQHHLHVSSAESGVNWKQEEHCILDGNHRINKRVKKEEEEEEEEEEEKHELQNKFVKENCLLVES